VPARDKLKEMRRVLIFALFGCALPLAAMHAQWQMLDAHTTADLRGVSSVGKGVVWISGTNGTVLRSEDAGYLWQHCTMPPGAEQLDFRGIQAFDANTAIVMSSGKGDLSRLYKTSDGCQTWKLVFVNPDKDGFWDAVSFEDPTPLRDHFGRGIVIGDPVSGKFAIFDSSDQGESWHHLDSKGEHARRKESLFAASNTAAIFAATGTFVFVTGGKGGSHFYRENPGGLVLDQFMTGTSLESFALPFSSSTATAGAFSLSKRGLDHVTSEFVIVGGDFSKPEKNGFAAFLPPPTYSFFLTHQRIGSASTPPHGYRSAVAYDDGTRTWITVGPNGTDVSTDDGKNWRALKPIAGDAPDADKNWNALSLPYVVGPHGRVGMLEPAALSSAK
jgi:photosystem II stability/assembly factor-like uncharacterized protein